MDKDHQFGNHEESKRDGNYNTAGYVPRVRPTGKPHMIRRECQRDKVRQEQEQDHVEG
jgi:hypothetical protein